MELKLDRKEIEAVLLKHVNSTVMGCVEYFTRVEWSTVAGSVRSATFDHTDIPQEDGNE